MSILENTDRELEESMKAFYLEAQKCYSILQGIEFKPTSWQLANLLFKNTTAHRRDLDDYVKGEITDLDVTTRNIQRGLAIHEFVKNKL